MCVCGIFEIAWLLYIEVIKNRPLLMLLIASCYHFLVSLVIVLNVELCDNLNQWFLTMVSRVFSGVSPKKNYKPIL